jgi:hypothetical protein
VLLTIADPSHRVTSGTGWEEQKNHRFYKGSWEQVEKCHEMCRSDKTWGMRHHECEGTCEGMQQIGLQLVTIEEDSGWDNAQKWTWEAHNLGKKRQFVAAAASPTRIFISSHQGWEACIYPDLIVHLGCAFDIVLRIYTTVFMFLVKSITCSWNNSFYWKNHQLVMS